MEVIFTIYKITGKCGRAYIGITRTPLIQRWKSHRRAARNGAAAILYDAIRENGVESFTIESICECYSVREAIRCERAMIAVHNTYYKQGGLNRNIGGGGNVTNGVSPETSKKISEGIRRFLANNPGHVQIGARTYNAMGRPVSPEGAERKRIGRTFGWTKEAIQKRQETWARNMANPEFAAARKHREWAVAQYEKALAARVGRQRPGRYHGERKNSRPLVEWST